MAQLDVSAALGDVRVETAKKQSALAALLLLAITIASASATRSVFSPMQDTVSGDLNFSDFQVSLIQGLAASIPIALDECVEAGRVKEGDLVLMASFGGGVTWGAVLMRW